MFYKILSPIVIAMILALVLPGSAEVGRAQEGQSIKIAMLSPRDGVVHQAFKKLGYKIAQDTNNAWSLRVFPSGLAGDEKDAIRKMEVGQLDGGLVTTVGLSTIEPQLAVLDGPATINSYQELDAVLKELGPEFEQMLLKKGYKFLFSAETGQYRIFSKGAIEHVSDLKTHRPWLWPESFILKEMWRESGAAGIPLGAPDVYGALQTRVIDALVCTPIALVAMRWHDKLDHVSAISSGVLLLNWIMKKSKWDALPETVRNDVIQNVPDTKKCAENDARVSDKEAYRKLLSHGYTAVKETPQLRAEWEAYFERVRKRLTGRLWPESLLKRVQAITAKVKS